MRAFFAFVFVFVAMGIASAEVLAFICGPGLDFGIHLLLAVLIAGSLGVATQAYASKGWKTAIAAALAMSACLVLFIGISAVMELKAIGGGEYVSLVVSAAAFGIYGWVGLTICGPSKD